MDYIVETNFEGPNFVMVPNAVAQSGRLSPEALGVLVYLASLPRGYLVRVGCIQETFQMGKDRWQRIARELRDVRAMEVQTMRGPGGRVIGRRVVVRWPDMAGETESRKTRLSDRKPEKPTVGKPAKQGGETRQTGPRNPAPYKDQKQKTGAQAALSVKARAAPSPAKGQALCSVSQAVDRLTAFQRSRLLAGQSVVVDGATVQPGSPVMERLRQALRAQDAVKRGVA